MKNNELIKKIFENEGIDEVGFAKVDYELPNAISIVVPLSKFVLSKITDQPTFEYFHHYRTVNAFIDRTLLELGMLLQSKGYRYITVAGSQSMPDKAFSGRS